MSLSLVHRDFALNEGKVSEHDLRLLHLTDSPSEVVQIVIDSQSTLRGLEQGFPGEFLVPKEP